MQPSAISSNIIEWYIENARNLPWRQTKDPYKIWLSEIILQQTRVVQGLPYYHKFIDNFPDVFTLAAATEDEILRLWQGLGYYSRARNLHACAQKVVADFNGEFPANFLQLLNLPGIGNYTAAAIASFAFNITVPAIDGNIVRVLSRLMGIFDPPYSSASNSKLKEISDLLIFNTNPADYNQAFMELGALICTPKQPACANCPAQSFCFAFQNNKVPLLPSPKKKTVVKYRYFNYLIIKHDDFVLIEKRTINDIWKNLFQFFLIESDDYLDEKELELSIKNQLPFKDFLITKISPPIEHKLTHRTIKTRFVHIQLPKNIAKLEETEAKYSTIESAQWIHINDLDHFAMPQLIVDYLSRAIK